MNTLNDVANTCEEIIDGKEMVSKEDLKDIVNIAYMLVSKLEDFDKEYGDRSIGYYGEFLHRDKNAREDALDIFGEILDEMNCYFED